MLHEYCVQTLQHAESASKWPDLLLSDSNLSALHFKVSLLQVLGLKIEGEELPLGGVEGGKAFGEKVEKEESVEGPRLEDGGKVGNVVV